MSWLDDLLSSDTLQSVGDWIGSPQGAKATDALFNMGLSYGADALGMNDPQIQKTGYLGEIPKYDALRDRVPNTYDPTRRPGSSGQRYFTDTRFVPRGTQPAPLGAAGLAALNLNNPARQTRPVAPVVTPTPVPTNLISPTPLAHGGIVGFQNRGAVNAVRYGGMDMPSGKKQLLEQQIQGDAIGKDLEKFRDATDPQGRYRYLTAKSLTTGLTPEETKEKRALLDSRNVQFLEGRVGGEEAKIDRQARSASMGPYNESISKLLGREPSRQTEITSPGLTEAQSALTDYNTGGIIGLRRGRYLDGPTSGMADDVHANIEGTQEARLSDGEFVVPADVVSHLGNGNSDAGADELFDMMDRVRKARTGTTKQAKEIDPKEFLPV
tara:strand:- start:298 stop:1443 length:1146 start_codon:yes stop_codon:yes gene_type:complete